MDTWDMIAAERKDLADLLETLTTDQWGTESLCTGWTVRVVAGHLVGWYRRSLASMIAKVVTTRSVDKTVNYFAMTDAQTPTADLIGDLRRNATNRFTPPFAPPEHPLTEIITHSLDIRVPLGLSTSLPPEHVNRSLDYLVSKAATRGMVPKDRVRGLSLSTTDTGWSHGDGPEARGPAVCLLLTVMGRPIGLEGLQGEGVPSLRRRIGA
jgi:uncharacterized protein (TIGR03083 family)